MEPETTLSLLCQSPWLLLVLLCILACVLWLFVFSKVAAARRKKSDNTSVHEHKPRKAAKSREDTSHAPEASIENPNPPAPPPKEQQESSAERAERRDRIRLAAEVVGAVLLLFYAWLTYGMYCANKKAAEAAQSAAKIAAQQLELTERPWVRIDLKIGGPLVIDRNGVNFVLQAVTKTTGNSPASVIMESKMYVNYAWPATLMNEKRDGFCEDLKKRALINQKYLKTVFPGTEELAVYQHLSVSDSELKRALQDNTTGRIMPLIVTCAIYQSTFNDKLYETAYSSMVMSIEQGYGMGVPGTKETTIPPEHLFISPETHAD